MKFSAKQLFLHVKLFVSDFVSVIVMADDFMIFDSLEDADEILLSDMIEDYKKAIADNQIKVDSDSVDSKNHAEDNINSTICGPTAEDNNVILMHRRGCGAADQQPKQLLGIEALEDKLDVEIHSPSDHLKKVVRNADVMKEVTAFEKLTLLNPKSERIETFNGVANCSNLLETNVKNNVVGSATYDYMKIEKASNDGKIKKHYHFDQDSEECPLTTEVEEIGSGLNSLKLKAEKKTVENELTEARCKLYNARNSLHHLKLIYAERNEEKLRRGREGDRVCFTEMKKEYGEKILRHATMSAKLQKMRRELRFVIVLSLDLTIRHTLALPFVVMSMSGRSRSRCAASKPTSSVSAARTPGGWTTPGSWEYLGATGGSALPVAVVSPKVKSSDTDNL